MSLNIHEHIFVPSESACPRTLLMLHGTGGSERDLLPLARMLDPEAAVLSPRGNVLERGMPRFFRRLAEGVFDAQDVVRRAADLATWIDAATQRYALNPEAITAVGFSNGANIAAAMMLLRPPAIHTPQSAILIRAMVPLDSAAQPAAHPVAPGTRALILAGLKDPIVPAENSRRLAAMLQAQSIEITLEELDSGHELTREDVTLARAWLDAGQVSRLARPA